MTTDSTTTVDDGTLFLGEGWSDPIDAGIRDRIRVSIEELIEEELAAAHGRGDCERRHRRGDGEAVSVDGALAVETGDIAPRDDHRHGHRRRRITGSFGTVEIAVSPRGRPPRQGDCAQPPDGLPRPMTSAGAPVLQGAGTAGRLVGSK